MTNDVNVASLQAFIEQLEIYVGELIIHLLDDELYCNNWPFDKPLNETSESDDNVVEPIVKVVCIHLLPLNCKTWPFDKLFNETSESPDNVDVKFKVAFIHFPFEYCKTWLLHADEILKSLKNEPFINVFSNKPT